MNVFLKIRANNNQNASKNQLSNSIKFVQKALNVNHKVFKKHSKDIATKDVSKGSQTNNVYQNTLKNVCFDNAKRTSELMEKIRNKERILNKFGLNKKSINIQKFMDKFNKNKKNKVPFKDIKINTIQSENDIEDKENHIVNLTDRNEELIDKIQKINCEIKDIEAKITLKDNVDNVDNVDKANKANKAEVSISAQYVEEYQEDIWNTLIAEQNNLKPKPDYMQSIQKDITEKMRYILLDWLLEVHLKFKLKAETFYLTVNIIDRYLSKVSINRKYLQLLGITALFSASKYEEIYSPEAKDLVYMCDSAYKKQDLINMENKVLHELNFDLTINSPLKYLDFFIIFMHFEAFEKVKIFTHFLCELAVISYNMLKFNACEIALASLYIAGLLYGKLELQFYLELINKSQLQINNVIECGKYLIANLNLVKVNKYNAILSKYKKSKFLEVVNDSIWQSNGKFVIDESGIDV